MSKPIGRHALRNTHCASGRHLSPFVHQCLHLLFEARVFTAERGNFVRRGRFKLPRQFAEARLVLGDGCFQLGDALVPLFLVFAGDGFGFVFVFGGVPGGPGALTPAPRAARPSGRIRNL